MEESISNDVAEAFSNAIEVPAETGKELAKVMDKVVKRRKPAPKKAAVKADEVETSREDVVAGIATFVDVFHPLVSDTTGDKKEFAKSLGKKSLQELKALDSTLREKVKIGNLTNQLRHLFYTLTSGVEVAGGYAGLKTSGYARVIMSQDAEVRLILQELAYTHKDKLGGTMRPEMRLAMLAFSTLMAVDARNRAVPVAPAEPKPEVPAVPSPDVSRPTVKAIFPEYTDL